MHHADYVAPPGRIPFLEHDLAYVGVEEQLDELHAQDPIPGGNRLIIIR